MNGAACASEEARSGMLDTPNSSDATAPMRAGTSTRDTTIQTTCATLPPEALNEVNMSMTEAGTQGRVHTMDSMTTSDFSRLRTMTPPPKGADSKEIIEFVKYQLDRIGQETEILDGLLLLGGGRTERLEGGVLPTPQCLHDEINS
jgi:hypothetical protein